MKSASSDQVRTKGKRKKRDSAQLAAQLAPLEELEPTSAAKQTGSGPHLGDPEADPHYGAIVVDNRNLNLPKDMIEGGGENVFLGMEPVVLVILVVMLTFIAFIAWQITLMPAP